MKANRERTSQKASEWVKSKRRLIENGRQLGTPKGKRVAVVGSGISAISSAWFLSQHHQVTVFEKDGRLGGHTNTVTVKDGDKYQNIDTGFIVFNRPNYPYLTAMFEHLKVATLETDMSFAVSVNNGELEYAGTGLSGMFAQRRNLLSSAHWSMIRQILRFNKQAKRDLVSSKELTLSLGEYLELNGFNDRMRDYYLLPMAAAIWSCPTEVMMQFPTRSFLQFFENHGLLNIEDRPQWETVEGGSKNYINNLLDEADIDIQLNQGVVKVKKSHNGVWIETQNGQHHHFDAVVLGCHADQAWRLLEDDLQHQFEPLKHFSYQSNTAFLHTDSTLMPMRRAAWSSWNYLRDMSLKETHVAVSYWMNLLQNLDSQQDFFVTLNPISPPESSKVIREIQYEHPVFDQAAMASQPQLKALQGTANIWFCGSYLGYGFHEDGLKSAVELARSWNLPLPWEDQTHADKVKEHKLDMMRTAQNAATDFRPLKQVV